MPARLNRNDVFEVYRRARIWSYDALTWDVVVQAMVREVADAKRNAVTSDVLVYTTRWDHRRSTVQLVRNLLMLEGPPDSAVPLLLLVLIGRPRSDPIVDVEDAPEFTISSEWIDPAMSRSSDGREVFVRVWTADSQGIGLAYLAEGKRGRSVLDQGVRLTDSLRHRLRPRFLPHGMAALG